MEPSGTTRCLLLACGNTLRGDDGVGPWLAAWAWEQFRNEVGVRVLSRQQWTPELAEDVARADCVIFTDCAANLPPGSVQIVSVQPADSRRGLATHHLGAAELLALGHDLYGSLPRHAQLLTVGAGSLELREGFSDAVQKALPQACAVLEKTVRELLAE